MLTDGGATQSTTMHPAATRRILRLALGTALCLAFSQAVAWPLSFIAPVLTLFVLALPLPPPGLKKSVVFVVAMVSPMILGGLVLLPFLEYARAAGILLVALGLFHTFYFTARGGNPVIGTFMTIGLTLIVTVGSISSAVMMALVQGLAVCAAVGLAFVALAHLLLPDLPPDPALAAMKKPPPPRPDPSRAGRLALRSLAIVFPMALAFLFMSGSPGYTVVMIKVATMGQQATADDSRTLGRSLLESTLWGGLGAIIGWNLLSIWPSLLLYTLLVALAGLIYGRWIFKGPVVHPKFQMASYAFLTMIVILAPAVLDGAGSSGAGAAFWNRLLLFVLIAVYGTLAVRVFDAFWPSKTAVAGAVQAPDTAPVK
jgi:hypothetical protein